MTLFLKLLRLAPNASNKEMLDATDVLLGK